MLQLITVARLADVITLIDSKYKLLCYKKIKHNYDHALKSFQIKHMIFYENVGLYYGTGDHPVVHTHTVHLEDFACIFYKYIFCYE